MTSEANNSGRAPMIRDDPRTIMTCDVDMTEARRPSSGGPARLSSPARVCDRGYVRDKFSGPSSSERRAGYTPTMTPEQRPANSVRPPTEAMEWTWTRAMANMATPAPISPPQYQPHRGDHLSDIAGPSESD